MVIKKTTDLGKDAIDHPGKYDGFLGISVGHQFYSNNVVEEYAMWASSIFKQFAIFLLDDPNHYNIMIYSQMEKQKSLQRARAVSDEKKAGYSRILKKNAISNITIIQCRDFIQDQKYQVILNGITRFSDDNEEFRKSLKGLMEEWVGGKIQEYANKHAFEERDLISAQNTLFHYVLEEVASLVYLTEKGYTIEVDPTEEFATKILLYEKKFQGFAKYISIGNRGHIFAYPFGKSKYPDLPAVRKIKKAISSSVPHH